MTDDVQAIKDAKTAVRRTYVEWANIVDRYDCGLHLTHYISGPAYGKLLELIDLTERLTVLDPECPKGVFKQIEAWRKIIDSAPSETETASRELAGVDL